MFLSGSESSFAEATGDRSVSESLSIQFVFQFTWPELEKMIKKTHSRTMFLVAIIAKLTMVGRFRRDRRPDGLASRPYLKFADIAVASLIITCLSLCMGVSADESSTGKYEQMRALNGGVFNHQCLVINDFIYIVSQKGYVAYSKVEENGNIGPWKYAQILFPEGMGENYFCAAAYGNCIYVLGGIYQDKLTDKGIQSATVIMARAKPEGGLLPWEKTTSLPEARIGGAAVVAKGCIYYVGGQYHRKVFFTRILDDGKLGEWKEAQQLPSNRYGMQVFAHGDYLYVVGGQVLHQKPVDTVFRTKIKEDGTLEKWRRTEPLPEPRAGYGGVIVGKDVFVFGGGLGDDAGQTATAVGTTIEADDHFADWKELPSLPMEASSLQAVNARKWIYVIGGIKIQEGGNKVWNTVLRYELGGQKE